MLARVGTALTISFGPVLDSTGAEYTGAVVADVKIAKNNGTPGALNASATLTHKEVGMYELVLTTADISAVGQATVQLSKTTYVAPPVRIDVLPAVVYDALVAGTDYLQADTVQIGGQNATAAAPVAFPATVGTSVLAAQDVRDAMKLAPTAGAPAAGSVDDHLDDMPADVWASTTRTLTSSAAATAAALTGSDLTIIIGDSFSAALTGLGSNTAYDTLVWTVKTALGDEDDDAIIQVRKGIDGVDADDGLRILNGAAATTAADGSITVVSATAATLALKAAATAELAQAHELHYSLKAVKADGSASLTLTAASCDVVAYATRATV